MSADLGVFPPASNPGGRYTAREGADRWTRVDRLLLYPVLAACGSEHAYLEAAVWLCRFLGRPPVFPRGKLPSRLETQLAAVKILERKTVTEGLAASPPFEELGRRAETGRRGGRPWTWVEVRLVRSLHGKRHAGEGAVAVSPRSFLTFLNRGEADLPSLLDFLTCLKQGRPLADPPEDRSARPAVADLMLAKALTRIRSIGEAEGSEFPAAWDGLYDVLEGNASSTLR